MFQSTVTAVSSSAGSLVAGHRVRSVLQVRGETRNMMDNCLACMTRVLQCDIDLFIVE